MKKALALTSLFPSLLGAALLACSTPADPSTTAGSPVTEPGAIVSLGSSALSVHGTSDGKYLVLARPRPDGGTDIVRVRVFNDSEEVVASLPADTALLAVGVGADRWIYWVTKELSGAWDVNLREVSLATPAVHANPAYAPTEVDRRSPPDSEDRILFSADGRHLAYVAGEHHGQLVVADLETATSSLVWMEPDTDYSRRVLHASADGHRALAVKQGYTSIESLRAFDLDATAPRLGPSVKPDDIAKTILDGRVALDLVRSDPDQSAVALPPKLGDGLSLAYSGTAIASGRPTVISVDVRSGASRVLVEGLTSVVTVGTASQDLILAGVRATEASAEAVVLRAARDGSSAPVTLASIPGATIYQKPALSHDGSTVFLSTRRPATPSSYPTAQAFLVDVAGVQPPRLFARDSTFSVLRAAGHQYLLEATTVSPSPHTSYVVVDDVTGETLSSIPSWPTFKTTTNYLLADDAAAVFVLQSCSGGYQVNRVAGDYVVPVLPCTADSTHGLLSHALALVPSSKTFIVSSPSDTQPSPLRDIVLVHP